MAKRSKTTTPVSKISNTPIQNLWADIYGINSQAKESTKYPTQKQEALLGLNAHLKFHFLDDTSLSLQILENSEYNIIISNNQKIILKQSHADKTAADKIFAAEKKYVSIAKPKVDYFNGLGEDFDGIETEDDLIANQRFEMLKRLTNLGIYVDEAHHAFGKALKKDFTEAGTTSLRKTINELAACLKRAGTHVVACYNYTGTPYVDNELLPEVVYTYALKDAIDNKYLKQADVKGYSHTKSKEFVKIAVKDFWKKYGRRRVEGMLPKLAFFASKIEELEKEVRPAVEEALAELEISADSILMNVGDDSLTTNDDLREFKNLDSPESEKQFILLVNKGKEGWNCRSLFGVALHREPKSKVFVLQATMRCLRAIGPVQETGTVYLSEGNRQILSEELQNNFWLNIDDFTGAGEKGKKPVVVKIVPPPVTVKLKRIRKHYELKELNLTRKVDFKLGEIDPLDYAIIETNTDLKRVGKDEGSKKVLEGVNENLEYSPLTLTAEIARYLGKSCLVVRRVLEESEDGMDAVVASVNRFNEILYDAVIPTLFKAFYDLEETSTTEEVEMRLVKPVKLKVKDGMVESKIVSDKFMVKPELLAARNDEFFAKYADRSFHLDNYCFDSKPELEFFKAVLRDDPEIEHLYFTGMLTSEKTDFAITYIHPESNTLRSYYPDFLAQRKDGSYVIVEVKGENKIDDAVVKAKARSALQLAAANAMTYEMIPSLKAAYGLRQSATLMS